MSKLILIDLDGVLVDWMGHVTRHFQLPKDFYFEPGVWDTVPVMLEHLNIDKEEFWEKQTAEFWATIPWLPDGQEILVNCMWVIGVNNCRFVTTPANGKSAHGKLWWMEYNAPYFLENRHYHLTHQKHELATPERLLLDDKDENVALFKQHGGKAILIPSPYNSRHKEYSNGHWLQGVKRQISKFWEQEQTPP